LAFGVSVPEIKKEGKHTQTKNNGSNKAISNKNILDRNQRAVLKSFLSAC
jgi:hypothetical protein